MKQQWNMIGGGFQHDVCSSAGSIPSCVDWIKDETALTSIYIDNAIYDVPNKNKKNYAWLSEARSIKKELYEWCITNVDFIEEHYELLFTHDKSLLSLSPKFKYTICNARTWIKDPKMFEKSKLISMIASNKLQCEEHYYRQQIIEKFKDQVDHFGIGFNRISQKEEGLKDYYFSIAMENGNYPLMFTEKITDCFATGTIPIYWGTDKISSMFNPEGIIMLTDQFEIKDLSSDLYHSKYEAIQDNFYRVLELPIAEDYIYENYLK